MDIKTYWKDVLRQDGEALRKYFSPDAHVNWHNTNERFTVKEFIRANCEYPGAWDGEVERVEKLGSLIISVVHVWEKEQKLSFHVTSFLQMGGEKILSIDEYWGDDGLAPQWRRDKHIGTEIR